MAVLPTIDMNSKTTVRLNSTEHHSQTPTSLTKPRLKSLDALRGFDMFWIIGGEGLFAALFTLTGWAGWNIASEQMQHSQWHGFTLYDLIFPLFIFLSGVALGLSPKRLDRQPLSVALPLYQHACKRLILLIALGILYNHGWGTGIPTDLDKIRYSSVLARIGFAWFFAAILVWHTGFKTQVIVSVSIICLYTLAQWYLPVPGGQAGLFTLDASINTYVDELLRPGIAYQYLPLDPEGVLSTVPAIINAMVGVFAGQFIIRTHPRGDWEKTGILVACGVMLLVLAWLLEPIIPVNKALWTTSFVLVTSGWSLLFLSLFYVIIDVLKWQKWAFVFVVIGTNAIIVYLGSSLIDWHYINRSLFAGVIEALPVSSQPLFTVIGFISVQWLVLWYMHRRHIFIRI
jgi:predicted acyltransferase